MSCLAPAQKASMVCVQAEQEAGPVREDEKVGSWYSNPVAKAGAGGSGVGRYLELPAQPGVQQPSSGQHADGPPAAKKPKQTAYGNFANW